MVDTATSAIPQHLTARLFHPTAILVNTADKAGHIPTGVDKAVDAVEEAAVLADEAARGEEAEAAVVEVGADRSRNPTSSRSSRRPLKKSANRLGFSSFIKRSFAVASRS